jgi:hypothetical protein
VFAATGEDWFFFRAITTSFCLLKASQRYQKQLVFGDDSDIALRAGLAPIQCYGAKGLLARCLSKPTTSIFPDIGHFPL